MSTSVDQRFIHHVQELRRRLLLSISFMMVAAVASYAYRDQIASFFSQPLHQSLIYTNPSGGLQFIMQICLTVGVIVSLPIFVYNLIQFIAPAFESATVRRARIFSIIAFSYILAISGLAFAYWLVIPMSLHFFAGFQIGGVRALISTSDYLSFVLGCLATFAAIFQLPLLLLSYNKINRFPPGSLTKYRRWVVIGSLGLALVLPFTYDPLTQFVIALPIIVLYELSIMLVWMSNFRAYRNTKAPQAMKAKQVSSETPVVLSEPAVVMNHTPAPTPRSVQPMHRALDRPRPVQLG